MDFLLSVLILDKVQYIFFHLICFPSPISEDSFILKCTEASAPLALALLYSSSQQHQPLHYQNTLQFLHEDYHAPSSLGKM